MAEKDSKVVNSGVTSNGAKFIVKKELPGVIKKQNLFTELIQKLKSYSDPANIDPNDILSSMNDKINASTYSYISKMKSVTGDEITRFLNKTLQSGNNGGPNSIMGIKNADDLLNSDTNNFQAFFFERYKNINNKYEDLRIITNYLYELQEAVTTMRDNISSADDLVATISRKIYFGSDDDAAKKSDNMIEQVEKLEEKYKLAEKLNNIIIPNTLTYGNFFVYSIPYSEIFAQFEYRKRQSIAKGGSTYLDARESFIHPTLEGVTNIQVTESANRFIDNEYVKEITEAYNSVYSEDKKKVITNEQVASELKSIMEGISISNDEYMPLLESDQLAMLADEEARKDALKAYKKASTGSPFLQHKNVTADGVVDTGEPSKEDRDMYKDIPDVFIKLYQPERVIPIYAMDYCVGYYVLYEAYGEIRNSILLNSSLNRTNLAFSSTKKKDLDDRVINVIAQSICNSIDKKYVANNPKFKELIVNAIAHEEFYKKNFKVQFIPSCYMKHFKIYEDPETHMGTSVLAKSLFYAKLYLSLLLFKIITILTKSNDMRVYYIRNAGINKNMVNRIQEIARGIKDKQISFNDLASIQTIFSKVGAYKEAFIPMGKSGEKNIEFDILSGQDVQLNTDLMELLRKGMINNTGVPSVILSYMEEADFARTLTMQHSKYMSRIIAIQSELEKIVTEWYKDLLTFDKDFDKEDFIKDFHFQFTRPKTLNAQAMSDLISNGESLADFITKMIVDESNSELTALYKQELIKSNLLSGVFNWREYEKLKEKVEIQLQINKKDSELKQSGES